MEQPFRITVTMDGRMVGFVKDLDSDGLFITTPRAFRRGEEIEIGLLAPGMLRPLQVKAVVIELKPGEGSSAGFTHMDKQTLTTLGALGRKLQSGKDASAPPGRKAILIVDDSDSIRSVFKSRLMLDGYDVKAVGTAMEAMKLLQQGERPDLILLDLVMPVMDGFKLLKVIRQSPSIENIPVLIMSARGGVAEIERAMALGISGYLVKTTTSPVKLSQELRAFFQRSTV